MLTYQKSLAVNYATPSPARLPLYTHHLVFADSRVQLSHFCNPLEDTCLCMFPFLQDADLETMKLDVPIFECLSTDYSKEESLLKAEFFTNQTLLKYISSAMHFCNLIHLIPTSSHNRHCTQVINFHSSCS